MNKNIPEIFKLDPLDKAIIWLESLGDMQIQLEIKVSGKVDSDLLKKAVVSAVNTVPILGCYIVNHWRTPFWQRVEIDKEKLICFVSSQEDYENFLLSPLDAYSGPQIQVCVWENNNNTNILFKVAHHVADASGVKEIVELISSAYNSLHENQPYCSDPFLTRSKAGHCLYSSIPKRKRQELKKRYLKHLKQAQKEKNSIRLPISSKRTEHPYYLTRTLSQAHTLFLDQYVKENGGTVNDLIVSAYIRAQKVTCEHNGKNSYRISNTVDLRRHLGNYERPVIANLSVTKDFWPDLGNDIGEDFKETFNKVRLITKMQKDDHLGLDVFVYILPIIRFIPHKFATRLTRSKLIKDHKDGYLTDAHTNMGIIRPESVFFGSKTEMARLLPPPAYPPNFAVGTSRYEDEITLCIAHYSDQKGLYSRFLDSMIQELPNSP